MVNNIIGKLTISFTLILFSVIAIADQSTKIAVVDLQRAVFQTDSAKKKLETLKQEEDMKQNIEEAEKLEAEYKKMVEAYQKNLATMSEEKRAEEERRLLEKQNDMKYLGSKLQQASKELSEDIFKEFSSIAQKVLVDIVKEKNIGLLLRTDVAPVVLHADDYYDITNQVTEKLNAVK